MDFFSFTPFELRILASVGLISLFMLFMLGLMIHDDNRRTKLDRMHRHHR